MQILRQGLDLAITADIGDARGFRQLVGHGVATEMALTASRRRGGGESHRARHGGGRTRRRWRRWRGERARALAAKSPLAAQGTKQAMLHARDHSMREGLEFAAMMNSARLTSEDLGEAMAARIRPGRAPAFSKL